LSANGPYDNSGPIIITNRMNRLQAMRVLIETGLEAKEKQTKVA
jgi:hypothetical protein